MVQDMSTNHSAGHKQRQRAISIPHIFSTRLLTLPQNLGVATAVFLINRNNLTALLIESETLLSCDLSHKPLNPPVWLAEISSRVITEHLSQDGKSSTERLNGTREQNPLLLASFRTHSSWSACGLCLSVSVCRLGWTSILRQVEQDVTELTSVLSVSAAAVKSSWVQRMSLRVEDVTAGTQNTLTTFTALLPGHVSIGIMAVQEVGGIKEQVKVLYGFCQEEGLHPVVQLMVPQIFDLTRTDCRIFLLFLDIYGATFGLYIC